jgi:MbtH protein
MTNPFEDNDSEFYALINAEEQYSLWPSFCDVPGGWSIELGPTSRDECLKYIETHWTDMRPLCLRRSMEATERASDTATAPQGGPGRGGSR